jgi:hypothetical protein
MALRLTLGHFIMQVCRHVDGRVRTVLLACGGQRGIHGSLRALRDRGVDKVRNIRRYCSTMSAASLAEAFSSVFFRGAMTSFR